MLLNTAFFLPLVAVAGRIVLSFKPIGFFDKYGEDAANHGEAVEGESMGQSNDCDSKGRKRATLGSDGNPGAQMFCVVSLNSLQYYKYCFIRESKVL